MTKQLNLLLATFIACNKDDITTVPLVPLPPVPASPTAGHSAVNATLVPVGNLSAARTDMAMAAAGN